MKKITSYLLVILLTLPLLTHAASHVGHTYQIELLIFSHLTPDALNSETWPLINPSQYSFGKAIDLKNTPGYQIVKQPSLDWERRNLRRNPNYQVLMYLTWQQPVYAAYSAKPVHIQGGTQYSDGTWQVDGTITTSVERYLNLKFNFLFAEPQDKLLSIANNPSLDQFNDGMVYFSFDQTRRMRSHELNYVDSPLYGILIRITPIT